MGEKLIASFPILCDVSCENKLASLLVCLTVAYKSKNNCPFGAQDMIYSIEAENDLFAGSSESSE